MPRSPVRHPRPQPSRAPGRPLDSSGGPPVPRSLRAILQGALCALACAAALFPFAGKSGDAAGRLVQAAGPATGWTLERLLIAALFLLAVAAGLLALRKGRALRRIGRGEREVQEGRSRIRLLMGQVPAVLWTTDQELRFTSSEGAGLRALGLQPGQTVGMSLYEYFQTDDPAFPPISAHLRALEGESAAFEANWMGEHFESYVEPLRLEDGDGRILGTVGVALNVTARMRAQAALDQSEAQLRQAQKMEAVGRLASGVAHDFNNLLTAIAGHTELAARSVAAGGPASRSLEEIRSASEKASALTRQLLVFSRKQVLEPRVLDVNTLVREMEGLLSRTLGEDVELITRLDPQAGSIRADHGQMSQVLLNLAVNARDAMPGGGKLLIETARTELGEPYASRHTGVTPGDYSVIAVSDTGTGIDKATQARIFEPFFTTKDPGEGTGLGLATVYGIVKQSGGNVWVYSEPGQGATFKLYLPLAAAGVADAGSDSVHRPAAEGSETLLLVEDDATVRALLADGLRLSGYTVLEASHGDEALRICRMHRRSIDVLITDVVMPQMSGRELVRRLEGLLPGVRILFMSGYTESAILQHGLLEPGTAFIQKPFTPEALARRVRTLVDREEKQPAAHAGS